MRISIEVVPRSAEQLERQLSSVAGDLGPIDTINIPDLIRFPLRSWEACLHALPRFANAIPHLRAIDVDPAREWRVIEFLALHGFREVIVVTGDAPADLSHPVYPCNSVQLIARLKRELPGLKVYGALDPYRAGPRGELDYARAKLDAGAAGFFTQPFFDLRFVEAYAEQLEGVPVFWGLTSVTSERSLLYWRNRNRAIFPASFTPTLEWNRAFAKDALDWAARHDQNLYFMPIRASIRDYLSGIV